MADYLSKIGILTSLVLDEESLSRVQKRIEEAFSGSGGAAAFAGALKQIEKQLKSMQVAMDRLSTVNPLAKISADAVKAAKAMEGLGSAAEKAFSGQARRGAQQTAADFRDLARQAGVTQFQATLLTKAIASQIQQFREGSTAWRGTTLSMADLARQFGLAERQIVPLVAAAERLAVAQERGIVATRKATAADKERVTILSELRRLQAEGFGHLGAVAGGLEANTVTTQQAVAAINEVQAGERLAAAYARDRVTAEKAATEATRAGAREAGRLAREAERITAAFRGVQNIVRRLAEDLKVVDITKIVRGSGLARVREEMSAVNTAIDATIRQLATFSNLGAKQEQELVGPFRKVQEQADALITQIQTIQRTLASQPQGGKFADLLRESLHDARGEVDRVARSLGELRQQFDRTFKERANKAALSDLRGELSKLNLSLRDVRNIATAADAQTQIGIVEQLMRAQRKMFDEGGIGAQELDRRMVILQGRMEALRQLNADLEQGFRGLRTEAPSPDRLLGITQARKAQADIDAAIRAANQPSATSTLDPDRLLGIAKASKDVAESAQILDDAFRRFQGNLQLDPRQLLGIATSVGKITERTSALAAQARTLQGVLIDPFLQAKPTIDALDQSFASLVNRLRQIDTQSAVRRDGGGAGLTAQLGEADQALGRIINQMARFRQELSPQATLLAEPIEKLSTAVRIATERVTLLRAAFAKDPGRVGLEASLQRAERGLQRVEAFARQVNDDFRAIGREAGLAKINAELTKLEGIAARLAGRGSFVELTARSQALRQEISLLTRNWEALGYSATAADRRLRELSVDLRQTEAAIQKIEIFRPEVGATESFFRGLTESFKGLIVHQIRFYTGMALIFGSVRQVVDAFKDMVAFEDSFRRIGIIAGFDADKVEGFADNLARTKQALRELARTSPVESGSSLAENFLEIVKAGSTLDDALITLRGAVQLSAVAGGGLENAINAIVTVQKAWGVGTDELRGKIEALNVALNLSRLDADDLATIFNFVASSAAQAGLDFEDVALAMAVLRNAGVKASQTGTGLSNLFVRLRTGSPKLVAALTEVGIALEDIKPGKVGNQTVHLIETFRRLSATGKDTQKVFDALFEGLSLRAGRAAAAFLSQLTKEGGIEEVNRLNQLILDASSGALDATNQLSGQYARAILTAQQQVKILSNNFQDLFKGVLESDGALAGFVATLNWAVDWIREAQIAFGKLNDVTGGALGIVTFALLVKELGGGLLNAVGATARLGLFIASLGKVALKVASLAGLGGLVARVLGLAASIKALFATIGGLVGGGPLLGLTLVALAVGTVVSVIAKLLGKSDALREFLHGLVSPASASAEAFTNLASEIDGAREAAERFGAVNIKTLSANVEAGASLRERVTGAGELSLGGLRGLRNDLNKFQLNLERPLEEGNPILAGLRRLFGQQTPPTTVLEGSRRILEFEGRIQELADREARLTETLQRIATGGPALTEGGVASSRDAEAAAVQRELVQVRADLAGAREALPAIEPALNLARQVIKDREFFDATIRRFNRQIESAEAPTGTQPTPEEVAFNRAFDIVDRVITGPVGDALGDRLSTLVRKEVAGDPDLFRRLQELAFESASASRVHEMSGTGAAQLVTRAERDIAAEATKAALTPAIATLERELKVAEQDKKLVDAANLRQQLAVLKAEAKAADAIITLSKAEQGSKSAEKKQLTIGQIQATLGTEIGFANRKLVEDLAGANIDELKLRKQAAVEEVKAAQGALKEALKEQPQIGREGRQALADAVSAAIGKRATIERGLATAERTRAHERRFLPADLAEIGQREAVDRLNAEAQAFPRRTRLIEAMNKAILDATDSVEIYNNAEKSGVVDAITLRRLHQDALKDELKAAEASYAAAIASGTAREEELVTLRDLVIEKRRNLEVTKQERQLIRGQQDLEKADAALAGAEASGVTDARTLAKLAEDRLKALLKIAQAELLIGKIKKSLTPGEIAELNAEIARLQDELAGAGKEARDWEVQFRTSMASAADVARSTAEQARDAWRDIFFDAFTSNFEDMDDVLKGFANSVTRNLTNKAADDFSTSIADLFSSKTAPTGGGGGTSGFINGALNLVKGFFGGGGTQNLGLLANPNNQTTGNFNAGNPNLTFSAYQTPAQAQQTQNVGTAIGSSAGTTIVDKLKGAGGSLATLGAGVGGQFAGRYVTGQFTSNNFPEWQQIGGSLGAAIGSIWGPVGAGIGGLVGSVGGEGFGRVAAEFSSGNRNVMKSEDWARLLGLHTPFSTVAAGEDLLHGDFSGFLRNSLMAALDIGVPGFVQGPIGLALFGTKADDAIIKGVIEPGIRKLGDVILLEIDSVFSDLSEFPSETHGDLISGLESVIEKGLAPVVDFANNLPVEIRGKIEGALSKLKFTVDTHGGEGDLKKASARALSGLVRDTISFYLGDGFDAISASIDELLPRNIQDATGITSFLRSFQQQLEAIGSYDSKYDAPEALNQLNEFLQSFFSSLNEVLDTVQSRSDDLVSVIKDFGRTGTDLIADLNTELANLLANNPDTLGLSRERLQANVDAYRAEFALATGADIIPAGDRLKNAIRALFNFEAGTGGDKLDLGTGIANAIAQFNEGQFGTLSATLSEVADAIDDPNGLTAVGRLTNEALALLQGGVGTEEETPLLTALRGLADLKDTLGSITGAESQGLLDDFMADLLDITDKQVGAAEEQQNIAVQQLFALGDITKATQAMANYLIHGTIPNPEDIGVPPDAGTGGGGEGSGGGGGGGGSFGALPEILQQATSPDTVKAALLAWHQQVYGQYPQGFGLGTFGDLEKSYGFLATTPGLSTTPHKFFDDGAGHSLSVRSFAEAMLLGMVRDNGAPRFFATWKEIVHQLTGAPYDNITNEDYRKFSDLLPTLPLFFRGIGKVPYDYYPALLHRGEAVLTASEAEARRAGNTSVEVHIGGPTISIQGAGEAGDELIRRGLRQGTREMTAELTRTLTSLGFVRN